MRFKVFTFFILGLFNVLSSLSLTNVTAHNNPVISKKSLISGEDFHDYKKIAVSLTEFVSDGTEKSGYEPLPIENSTFNFIVIMSNEKIEEFVGDLLSNKEKMLFFCKNEVIDYIIKSKVNDIAFLKDNCIELKSGSYEFQQQPSNRRLMQRSELKSKSEFLFDVDQGDANKASENCEIPPQKPDGTDLEVLKELVDNTEEKKSSCCGKKKSKFKELESEIQNNFEELFENNNSSELDGFNVTEIVQSKDDNISFKIEINDKTSIFDEILEALKNESESIISYDSIEERNLSNSELKEALRETEKEINNKKVEMRGLKEVSDSEMASSRSRSKSLRSTRSENQINLRIKNEISGIPLYNISETLTYRFIQTENKELKSYFTPTKTKLLYLAIYEYLVVYSTLEDNLEKVVEIINGKNGIFKLHSFFGNYINFASMRYVFEQYFAKFDYIQERRLYYKSDFTRFMLNLIINQSDPKLTSPIFNLKLEIATMIIFYSEDDLQVQKIVIRKEINDTNKQMFYRDNVFFNFLLVKHFSFGENDKILEKTNEVIVRNRNNNPLDRPKQCFIQVKRLLLGENNFHKFQNNEEILKVVCLQTYGLLGLYSTFDRL
ncbi:unnamed protein product [Cryptosporidium hominis]|uniref:Uncharacterized protein n=1 Tax=Cryptosporidium hominis TaxID=237895 RepID=A0A0S4THH1_CRYHO|nr:hypothetical protein ChTU502y2012_406g0305 [Cryptosporidium hominis]PPA64779.1 hypothetical protein ChUKH1_01865 [Cryptosporidium hominis]PPS97460.1 Uncharacterized protein GY17_00000114 [Cryptosporidium hominis]CUV06539.1 unnamed protein product [Cryptosporidium hominis]|eukprot:PPS97460.1 Uncharacterized protein GY17_00000114 [Cryptosporidium hominis]